MKDLKISKKLFETVYNCDIATDKDMLGVYKRLTVYEVAFKCKDWLKNNVSNSFSGFDNGHRSFCHIENFNLEDRFYEDSEVEAIIKACEHILNEVNK